MNNLLNKLRSLKIGRDKFKLDKLDNKAIVLIILACLIIVYLDFKFLVKLQLQSIKKTGQKITQLKADLDTLTKGFDQMQEIKNKQIEAHRLLLSKAKRIISEEQVTWLLQQISVMANNNNVKIVQIKPSKEESRLRQEKDADKSRLTPLLITLDLFADYHKFGKFINDLENAEIFIAVRKIKINSQPTDYHNQKVNLVLRTYVKK